MRLRHTNALWHNNEINAAQIMYYTTKISISKLSFGQETLKIEMDIMLHVYIVYLFLFLSINTSDKNLTLT